MLLAWKTGVRGSEENMRHSQVFQKLAIFALKSGLNYLDEFTEVLDTYQHISYPNIKLFQFFHHVAAVALHIYIV